MRSASKHQLLWTQNFKYISAFLKHPRSGSRNSSIAWTASFRRHAPVLGHSSCDHYEHVVCRRSVAVLWREHHLASNAKRLGGVRFSADIRRVNGVQCRRRIVEHVQVEYHLKRKLQLFHRSSLLWIILFDEFRNFSTVITPYIDDEWRKILKCRACRTAVYFDGAKSGVFRMIRSAWAHRFNSPLGVSSLPVTWQSPYGTFDTKPTRT